MFVAREPRFDEVADIARPEIEQIRLSPFGRSTSSPANSTRREVRDVASHLVRRGTDRRTDRGDERAGIAAELGLHLLDRSPRDVQQRAGPTRVRNADCGQRRIENDHGHTVRRHHGEDDARLAS